MKSKPHDQRKGQWLYNKIRENKEGVNEKDLIPHTLWNMSNEEFDKIMEEYYK